MAILAAEADVSSPFFINRDVQYLFPGLVENRYAIAREIDVAFIVDRHTIRSHGTEELFIGQIAVFLDTIGVGFSSLDIRYVEGLSVRSSDDAVRFLQIVNHQLQLLAFWRKIVDPLAGQFHRPPMPVIARIVGIGDIQPAIGTHPDIVRSVKEFPLVIRYDFLHLSVRIDPPELILLVRARP